MPVETRTVVVLLAIAAIVVVGAGGLTAAYQAGYIFPPDHTTTQLTIHTDTSTSVTVTALVADTHRERYIGLGQTPRTRLNTTTGMLFVYPTEGARSFVMRNMEYGLDIIFISDTGRVVKIAHADAVGTNAPYTAHAQYVLELPRGAATTLNITTGDTITGFPGTTS